MAFTPKMTYKGKPLVRKDKVQLMLVSTADTSKVMRQITKRGLYNALESGGLWLQDANPAH